MNLLRIFISVPFMYWFL